MHLPGSKNGARMRDEGHEAQCNEGWMVASVWELGASSRLSDWAVW